MPGLVAAAETEMVDRVVAIVDDDPILLSELRRALALGLSAGQDGSRPLSEREALERLIDQRLRIHAVVASGVIEISRDRVATELERTLARFENPEQRLTELGLDREQLASVVRRQLELATYVDERLGARVFVSLEEIRAHFEQSLVPELEARGAPVPKLAEVRESIRTLLRERALDAEVAKWTEQLRAEADVIDLLDAPPREDPPLRAVVP